MVEQLLPGCKLIDCKTCECCWCDTHNQRSIFCAIEATQRGDAKIASEHRFCRCATSERIEKAILEPRIR